MWSSTNTKNPTMSVGLVESGLDHLSHWKLICSRHDIAETSCDSRDMYNDCVCIYTLYMADYFLVLIFTDVLMI
jgi:hypothetical protein